MNSSHELVDVARPERPSVDAALIISERHRSCELRMMSTASSYHALALEGFMSPSVPPHMWSVSCS